MIERDPSAPPRLFVFGLGYTALALADRLMRAGWRIAGTCRRPARVASLRARGIDAHVFDRDHPLADARALLADARYVLSSVPPDETGPDQPTEQRRVCAAPTAFPNANFADKPWAADYLRLPEAQKFATGAGITVAVIDTGVNGSPRVPAEPGHEADYDLVRRMRASIAVLGPLLARCGRVRVARPGGDAIGSRGLDMHIDGLVRLGAEVRNDQGFVVASAPDGLTGAAVTLWADRRSES